MSYFQDLEFLFTKTLKQKPKRVLCRPSMLSLCLVIQSCLRKTPLGLRLRVIVTWYVIQCTLIGCYILIYYSVYPDWLLYPDILFSVPWMVAISWYIIQCTLNGCYILIYCSVYPEWLLYPDILFSVLWMVAISWYLIQCTLNGCDILIYYSVYPEWLLYPDILFSVPWMVAIILIYYSVYPEWLLYPDILFSVPWMVAISWWLCLRHHVLLSVLASTSPVWHFR